MKKCMQVVTPQKNAVRNELQQVITDSIITLCAENIRTAEKACRLEGRLSIISFVVQQICQLPETTSTCKHML
jgi:hypothetical protein